MYNFKFIDSIKQNIKNTMRYNFLKNSLFIHNFHFSYLLVFIFIISLVSGPFIPDLIVSFSAIVLLFNYNQILQIIRKSRILQILFLFWFYILFSSIFSSVPLKSFFTSFTFLRFLLFVIAVNLLMHEKNLKYVVFYSFLFLYSSLFFDSIYQIISGHNILGYPIFNERVSSFFGKELIMGSFISRTFFIVLYLLFSLNLRNKEIFYFYIVTISLFLVIVSSERTAFFMYSVTLIFSLLFFNKKNILKIIFFIISLFFIFLFLNKPSLDRLYNHTLSQIVNTNTNKLNLLSYRHQLHFETAFKIFQQNKIFGAGIKSFRYICSEKKYSSYDKILLDNKFYAKKSQVGKLFVNNDKNGKFQNFQIIKDDKIVLKFLYKDGSAFKLYLANNSEVKEGDLIYSYYEFENGCNTHPHNFYIQFLSEIGIIGFCFLTFFFIFTCYRIIKFILTFLNNKFLDPKLILWSGYFAVFFPLIPNGNFFNNYLCLLTFLPLGFYNLCKKY